MTTAGGRPRDPRLADRVLVTTTALIATNGMAGLTADVIASEARVGKASIYRRWRSLDELLAAVVEDLGVRDEDLQFPDWSASSLRGDLDHLFAVVCTGSRALAEVAVLSAIGTDARLQAAYQNGPAHRLKNAVAVVTAREQVRGTRYLDGGPILAGVAWLQKRMATTGRQALPGWIEDCLDYVVLPALGREPVRS